METVSPDALAHIFQNLSPCTLYHVSLTSKLFFQTIFSRHLRCCPSLVVEIQSRPSICTYGCDLRGPPKIHFRLNNSTFVLCIPSNGFETLHSFAYNRFVKIGLRSFQQTNNLFSDSSNLCLVSPMCRRHRFYFEWRLLA